MFLLPEKHISFKAVGLPDQFDTLRWNHSTVIRPRWGNKAPVTYKLNIHLSPGHLSQAAKCDIPKCSPTGAHTG